MNSKKQPKRRTFLQDRFDVLIKRQKSGKATFSELTELDDIVNRDPEIREKVIRESMLMENNDEFEEPMDNPQNEKTILEVKKRSLLSHIKSLLARIFHSQIVKVKTGNAISRPALLLC